MKLNKYFPFVFIYFFINSLALPYGLTYMAILSPLFYYWVFTTRKTEILLPFFICLIPFFIFHMIFKVDTKAYFISVINYAAVYIFCQAFYTFLKKCDDPEKIFKKILIINFLFCLIAIPVYFTSFDHLIWIQHTLSEGIDNIKRLKLFTYEASYYATLFTPLFFFYLLQLVLHQNNINSFLLLPMLILPYILSFSIGVIGSIFLAVIITFLLYFRSLTKKKRALNLIVLMISISAALVIILFLFFPQNNLFLRIENIISGIDTSGKGRTSDAYFLASQILEQKSMIWGVGPGQIKILGADIIRNYYLYDLDYNKIAIPNAVAETLAIFGWVGFSLRFLVEFFFFFYTKVWTNYYRLLLFIFIFLYQFTGSFITNIAEYVIWILAFTNVFPDFDIGKKHQKSYHIHQNSTI